MERSINFQFEGKSFNVDFPNYSRLLRIETLKSKFTSGEYGAMLSAGTKSSVIALDIVDMASLFTVLCPDLQSQIKGSSFMELTPGEMAPLMKIYKKKIAPWWNGWMNELKAVEEIPDEEENESTE